MTASSTSTTPASFAKNFDILVTTRRLLEKLIVSVDEADLTRVPPGFNNHLLWNLGHLVVTQQLLCYRLAGLPMAVDEAWVGLFAKGSSPAEWPADAEIPSLDKLLEAFHGLPEQLRRDYESGRYGDYQAYTTSAGVTLESIEDAVVFNTFHEGIHMGSVLALRRALGIAS